MTPRWLGALRRRWMLYHLAEAHFAFMYDAPPEGRVGHAGLRDHRPGCAARPDHLDRRGAHRRQSPADQPAARTAGAARAGVEDRERARAQAARAGRRARHGPGAGGAPLLDFIGSRPLVGYYLEFDVAMLNREIWPLLGVRLPQPKIEVSAMYYDYKNRQLPAHQRDGTIDLRFADHHERPGAAAARCARRAQRRRDGGAGFREVAQLEAVQFFLCGYRSKVSSTSWSPVRRVALLLE